MKKLFTLLLMPLMLGALAACSDSSEELVKPEEEKQETRTDAGTPAYYWSNGMKQAITLTNNKTYILFHPSDQETVLNKIAELGINVTLNEIFNSGIYAEGMEETNEKSLFFDECRWIGVDISCEQALTIPGVIYAAPYFLDQEERPKFCITSFINVSSNGSKELIEQVADEYQAYYLGYRTGYGDYTVHYIGCDKNSKGNALEIANALVESHLFVGAEPVIMGPSHGHGFATEGPIH